MSVNEDVVIGNGRCRVTLSLGRRGFGIDTLIDIVAGPFHGEILGKDVWDYRAFLRDLSNLHRTLKGTAEIGDCDRRFSLTLTGNGRGEIVVKVEAADEQFHRIALACEFAIDQSYLPAIIERLTTHLGQPK
jgi:hypothetical protein